MSSSEDDMEENVFAQQRSLFMSGLDAFMVALHRYREKYNKSLMISSLLNSINFCTISRSM